MIKSAARTWTFGAALLLSGCAGGLLGGGRPNQLYRFGPPNAPGAVTSVGAGGATSRTLRMQPPTFAPEISGDRILTSQGEEVSYVKDRRWVAATPALYQAAVEASIRAGAEIIVADGPGPVDGDLRISVERFEAVYGQDDKNPPVVEVDGRASLSIDGAATPMLHRVHGERRASANTSGAVAAAFDAAVAESTTDLAEWLTATLPRRGPGTRRSALIRSRKSASRQGPRSQKSHVTATPELDQRTAAGRTPLEGCHGLGSTAGEHLAHRRPERSVAPSRWPRSPK